MVAHDRTAIVAARRGGQDSADAAALQKRFAREIHADIARDKLSVNSLAQAVGIKAGTLKGYLDGTAPWQIGVLQSIAQVLGRSHDADLVALGLISGPMAQTVLRQQQQLRLAEMMRTVTASYNAHEPLFRSIGAQVAAAIITSPDDLVRRLDTRIKPITRGINRQRDFCEVIAVEVSGARDYEEAKRTLLNIPVLSMPGIASPHLADIIDFYGAHVEESVDYRNRLCLLYGIGPKSVMISVPKLLAPRFAPLGVHSTQLAHLDGVAITSMGWGGAEDISSLVAEGAKWNYQSVEMLARQMFGGGPTLLDSSDSRTTAAHRTFYLNCCEISELLVNPRVIGRHNVVALDQPAASLSTLKRLSAVGDRQNVPLVMVRISAQRLKWTCRLVARDPEHPRDIEWIEERVARLTSVQEDLTRAVADMRSRPVEIFELPEPDVDYESERRDFVDEDFDSYANSADQVREWLIGLNGRDDDSLPTHLE